MEGRSGGCCIARYAGGHASAYDMSKMDRIMLRFRPIAPKPAANGEVPTANGGTDGHGKAVAGGRGRRKSVKESSSSSRRCTNGKKRKSSSPDQTAKSGQDQKAVTLALLPEAPDLSPTEQVTEKEKPPMWVNFGVGLDLTAAMPPPQQEVVVSFVIVEGITDTWADDIVARNMMRRLEEDTCPGFLSDGWNRVWWTNEAYRRMVMGDTWGDHRMEVSVVMRERVPDTLQAFTCRVRVQRSCDGKQIRGSSLTLPCDVWRIDGGGFAWRLDVDAALSLGR